MEKVVWKYELKIQDVNELEIPINGKILTLQIQNDVPCLWVLVDPKQEKRIRKIYIVGTGNAINKEIIEYIGTFQTYHGNLVWHVFEFFL